MHNLQFQVLAEFQNEEVSSIVSNHIGLVLSYLFCNSNETELDESLMFIRDLTNKEISKLISGQLHDVYFELISKLGKHKKPILDGMRLTVIQYDENIRKDSPVNCDSIASLLQPRLLGK